MGCNKQQLIKLNSGEIVMRGCMFFQAQSGADLDSTKSAVNSVQEYSTKLTGKETDL